MHIHIMKIKEHGAQRTRITNNKCKTGRMVERTINGRALETLNENCNMSNY